MALRQFILPLLCVAVACDRESNAYRPLSAGDDAPAYAAPVLDGDTVSLASLRGNPVLLNVWATWCAPCREEMPELQQLHERYSARGLRVIGASIDARGGEEAMRSFLTDHGVTFTILHDANELVSSRFRTNGVPETFLIDADGKVVQRWIGPIDAQSKDVVAKIEAVLAS